MDNKHILIILDGYGIAVDPSVSAIDQARKPFLDRLFATYPHSTLEASGFSVGLPEGQMGNSEVGHMNLGAGRVVYQEITRIDRSIEDKSFFSNSVLLEAVRTARRSGATLHLMGLFSGGGVHSRLDHLLALLQLAAQEGLEPAQVAVHAFTDGRDTDPHGAEAYARSFEMEAARIGVGRIASIVGRYWAMDRDGRWNRIERAYRLLVDGFGERHDTAESALSASYKAGITDEFVEPAAIGSKKEVRSSRIRPNDVVVFFNFRADRARQLTRALTDTSFTEFSGAKNLQLHFTTFTPYEHSFSFPVAFPHNDLAHTLGKVIAERGGTQLRAAESEKYPHVTYFFSGGRETPFHGEERLLVPSPKVSTYDLQPEMSAPGLADEVSKALLQHDYDLVVLNFANPDMVGHTGVFEAAVCAVQAVDQATEKVVTSALKNSYSVSIIADHGNADKMRNPDGSPHTAHTTALVPHLIIKDGFDGPVQPGKLGDIAPTILRILDIPIPEEMTGSVLI